MAAKKTDEKFSKKEKDIMYSLAVLDEFEMNISKASRELKISRPTLIKYRDENWGEYIALKNMTTSKNMIKASDLGFNTEMIETAVVVSATERKIHAIFDKITNRVDVILSDPKLTKKISFNALIYAANVMLPYIQAKKQTSEPGQEDKQADTVLAKIKKAMAEKARIHVDQVNIQNNYNDNSENKL